MFLEAFEDDHQNNPGGHELVVFIGLVAPSKAPLIGPPERPQKFRFSEPVVA